MKQSSALRILGALLVAAGAVAQPEFGAPGRHELAPHHEELMRHVEGGAMTLDGEVPLLHPLHHYVMDFLAWSFKYDMEWSSTADAVHALKVNTSGDFMYLLFLFF